MIKQEGGTHSYLLGTRWTFSLFIPTPALQHQCVTNLREYSRTKAQPSSAEEMQRIGSRSSLVGGDDEQQDPPRCK